MIPPLPPSWQKVVGDQRDLPYFKALEQFVAQEQSAHEVFPPAEEIFTALDLTPFQSIRLVILGQDPYPTPGHAHGLAFSVRPGVKPPGSLVNIFKELQADLGHAAPKRNGSLIPWAGQGVLLLNTVLTVRSGAPLSHRGKGWETFTDAVMRAVGERETPAIFVLWGAQAQAKAKGIDTGRHIILKSAHPSPLSARTGFFGSRPFSQVNQALQSLGQEAVGWKIDEATA